MKQLRSRLLLPLVAALVVENAWLAYPTVRDRVLQVERSDVRRGRELATRLGCFTCHGPGGSGGVRNPGSKSDTVPAFREQTPMMFVHSDQDVREYILDGAPAAKRVRESYRNEMAGQAIHMPAFRNSVGEQDIGSLVAYVRAASELLGPSDSAVARGAEVVRKNGCFACHGEMGSGGQPNVGSFKGYIPGFIGPDFADLVRDDDELLGWIRDGSIPRLANHPIASRFLERQRIQMPAYKNFLEDDEIKAAAAYVRWLAGGTWRTQPLVSR